jgi:hypothetical protein
MMRKGLGGILLGMALGALLAGCGVVDDSFEGASRLNVQSIKPATAPPVYMSNKVTDDGAANPSNPGAGNHFPDSGEVVITELTAEPAKVTVFNEPRLGVANPVDLEVYQVAVSYVDKFNNARPQVAPPSIQAVAASVAPNASAVVDFVLVDIQMRTREGGIAQIFRTGVSADNFYGVGNIAAEREAASQWTAIVDVYSRDVKNNDTIHGQGRITFQFFNPME